MRFVRLGHPSPSERPASRIFGCFLAPVHHLRLRPAEPSPEPSVSDERPRLLRQSAPDPASAFGRPILWQRPQHNPLIGLIRKLIQILTPNITVTSLF